MKEPPNDITKWHHALHQVTGDMAKLWTMEKKVVSRWAKELEAVVSDMKKFANQRKRKS